MIQDHSRFAAAPAMRGGIAARAYRGEVADRVARFLPMVRKLAWHLSGSAGPALDVDDLMQAGLVALTECAQRHEGPGEDGFAAYAKLRVRGAMVDLLRSASTDPRGARARRRRIEQAEQELRNPLGREASAGELAGALGMAIAELHRLRASLAAVRIEPLDDCYSDSDARFGAPDDDAESLLLRQEDRALLAAAIGDLPERLQLVVQLYFVEELNLTEIAQVIGVSVPRVHQLKAAALDKLRASLVEAAE